jgi:hypothetical protein
MTILTEFAHKAWDTVNKNVVLPLRDTFFSDDPMPLLSPWVIEKDVVIHKNKVFEAGFEIIIPNTARAGAEAVYTYQRVFENMLRNIIPEGERVRLIVRSLPLSTSVIDHYETLQNADEPISKELTKRKSKYLKTLIETRSFKDMSAYFMFTVSPINITNTRKETTLTHLEYFTRMQQLKNLATKVSESLRNASLNPRRLSTQECFKLMVQYLNPDQSFDEVKPYIPITQYLTTATLKRSPHLGEKTVREQIFLSEIDTQNQPLQVGKNYVQVVSADRLPHTSDPLYSSSLLQHRTHYWLILEGKKHPVERSKRDLLNQVSRRNASVKTDEAKNNVANASDESSLSAARGAYKHMDDTGATLFDMTLSVVLYGTDREAVQKAADLSANRMSTVLGIKPLREHAGLCENYFRLMPFQYRLDGLQLTAFRVMDDVLSDFVPWDAPWKGNGPPRIILQNDWNSLTAIDPREAKHLANKNGFICGGSGQGKSMFTQSMIADLLADKTTRVAILDQKRDYERLVKLFGGTIISIRADGSELPNPFDLEDDNIFPDEEKEFFLNSLLTIMILENKGGMSGQKANLLASAIRTTYVRKTQRVAMNNTIKEVLDTPILSDVIATLQRMESAGPRSLTEIEKEQALELSHDLTAWSGQNPLGKIFDRKTVTRKSSRLMYYDLSGVRDLPQLAAVTTLLVLDQVWRRATKNINEFKAIILEECWQLLSIPSFADYISRIYRLSRAFNTGVYAITQDPKDLIGENAKGIIGNTSVHYMLPCPGSETVVGELFDFSNELVQRYKHMTPYKHVLVWLKTTNGNQGDILTFKPDSFRYWLFTSKPEEVELLNTEIHLNGGDIIAAIDAITSKQLTT